MHLATQSKPRSGAVQSKRVTVKAIVVEQYGGPEVLKPKEVEIGEPGPGQTRVRIAMAGVNFVDIYQRCGTYPRQLPYIPGLEGAGVVEAVGERRQQRSSW
jgi:NADPH2:quinone reductase